MKILVNAISARPGGGAKYINCLIDGLGKIASPHQFVCFLPAALCGAIKNAPQNIILMPMGASFYSARRRVWFDQITLRNFIKREKIDVLYSTANFGMVFCPCRQVLLIQNTIYFSKIYYACVLRYKSLTDKIKNFIRVFLIFLSIKSSDITIAPSRAALEEVLRFFYIPENKCLVNQYGLEKIYQGFSSGRGGFQSKNTAKHRLLYTAVYYEHKNLKTLLLALGHLTENKVPCKLITTANPRLGFERKGFITKEDIKLSDEPRLKQNIEFKNILNSDELTDLYKNADIFVYPTLVESFGFPLLEAMASGLPVVASDIPVNRELCQDAALYFNPFDSRDCAEQIRRVAQDNVLGKQLIEKGLKRVEDFSWESHIRKQLNAFEANK